jgi:hypothetical protein
MKRSLLKKLVASFCTAKPMSFNRFLGALAVCVALASPAAAQSEDGATFTPSQFYALGVSYLRDNNASRAARVATALLQRNPNDVAALRLAAEAAISQNDFTSGLKFARSAYFNSENRNNKFATARLAALAASQMRRDTLAQLWLRRARQFSPNAATAKNVAEDYRFLRNRNPWSSSLRFGATPSSNINNGSANEKVSLFDFPGLFTLDGEGRALSGMKISAGGDTAYRLSQSNTAVTFLTASADVRTYVLSGTAKAQAPEARGRDFSDATLAFGVRHRRILSEGARPTDFSLKAGQTWYGGDPYARFAEGSVGQSFKINPDNQIYVSLSARRRISLEENPLVSTVALNTRWRRSLQNNDTLSFGLGVNQTQSDAPDSDYMAVRYTANYNLADSFYGLRFGFGVDAETRDFDATQYQSGPRADKSIAVNMSVEFTNWELYGFRPVMNVRLKRNKSNVDLFDRDYSSMGFDLRSSF